MTAPPQTATSKRANDTRYVLVDMLRQLTPDQHFSHAAFKAADVLARRRHDWPKPAGHGLPVSAVRTAHAKY